MEGKHDIYYMNQSKCTAHKWHVYDLVANEIRCQYCNDILDAKPLSAHELIRAIYDSTDNIYYTLCSMADGFGGDLLKEYNIKQRLSSLSSIAFQYPKEMDQLKSTLTSLHLALSSAGSIRGIQISIMTTDGCKDETVPAFNLEYYDNLIVRDLESFAFKVLAEEGYTEAAAKSYLALQEPKLSHRSFFQRTA
jgi:hypothetical protein